MHAAGWATVTAATEVVESAEVDADGAAQATRTTAAISDQTVVFTQPKLP